MALMSGQLNSDNTFCIVLLIAKCPAMTYSCANFITSVRHCCGTINCVKVLPCSTFGELNFRYNKAFFFKNVALPMVSFASHQLLVVVRLTSSFWALLTCAGVMVLSIILGVFSLLVTPSLLACALVCTANAGVSVYLDPWAA